MIAYFEVCNLKQFGNVCPVPPQKWQNHWGLCYFLLQGWLRFLGFDSLRSILILLVARISSLGTLTLGVEIDVVGTNLGGWTTEVETLYTNPNPVLLEKYFWTFNLFSNLEAEVLSSCSLATDNSDSKLLTFSIK